ncbi:hypothetical protein RHA1_ro09109 (plasmid) [Rhodococcus jostii RHA1]|uniref:Uncharacterized protein n=1 Tax=Rhodococcus jostii (strain RHA1) TaxID=101510 RepID=Q0RX34_RHOJR|nr:hypothetical protein RHA1_ro09109 [Rhodococcus jostii RHA1]
MQPAPVPCQASRFCCLCCPRRWCCRRHRPRLLTIQRSIEPGAGTGRMAPAPRTLKATIIRRQGLDFSTHKSARGPALRSTDQGTVTLELEKGPHVSRFRHGRHLIEVGQNGRICGLEVETHLFRDPTPDRIVGGHSNHHLRGTRRGRPHSSRPCRMVPADEPSEEAVPTPGRGRTRNSQTITGRGRLPADCTDLRVVLRSPAVPLMKTRLGDEDFTHDCATARCGCGTPVTEYLGRARSRRGGSR